MHLPLTSPCFFQASIRIGVPSPQCVQPLNSFYSIGHMAGGVSERFHCRSPAGFGRAPAKSVVIMFSQLEESQP